MGAQVPVDLEGVVQWVVDYNLVFVLHRYAVSLLGYASGGGDLLVEHPGARDRRSWVRLHLVSEGSNVL